MQLYSVWYTLQAHLAIEYCLVYGLIHGLDYGDLWSINISTGLSIVCSPHGGLICLWLAHLMEG